MTPVRNEVFTGLEHRSCYLVGGGGGVNLWGGGAGFSKKHSGVGEFYPHCEIWQILLADDFLLGGGNLRSDLDHLSLTQI